MISSGVLGDASAAVVSVAARITAKIFLFPIIIHPFYNGVNGFRFWTFRLSVRLSFPVFI